LVDSARLGGVLSWVGIGMAGAFLSSLLQK
jgi:hypothetical protein